MALLVKTSQFTTPTRHGDNSVELRFIRRSMMMTILLGTSTGTLNDRQTRQMEIIAPSWFDVFSCSVADMIWCDMKRKICNSWIIVGLEPELVWLPPLPVDRRRCHWPIQKPLIVYIVNHIRSNNFLSIGLVFYLSPVLSFTLNANECMMWGMGLPWWGSIAAAATDKRREWWGSLTLCGNFIRIYCPLWFFCRVYWKYLWVR